MKTAKECLRVSLLIIATSLVLGCQQPVTNPGNRGPFSGGLPRLFGGQAVAQNNGGLFGGNQAGGNSSLGNGGFGSPFSGGNVFGLANGTNGQGTNGGLFQNGSYQGTPGVGGLNPDQYAAAASQFNNLNQRLTAYDADNQLLNTELAAVKQKLEMANQYGQTLKQQLADTSARVQQAEMDRQAAISQLASAQGRIEELTRLAQSSTSANTTQVGFGGGQASAQLPAATLNANNSLARRIGDIQIPGGQARLDGDVIRIEIPTDTFFVPGQYQIRPAQLPMLQNIVATIRQSFPKQIIGVEAHWDGSPLNPATMSHHQLTSNQALTVIDRLTNMGLPQNQLFMMAMGSNRPRHAQQFANGISPNRRIELVIYPETFDGSN